MARSQKAKRKRMERRKRAKYGEIVGGPSKDITQKPFTQRIKTVAPSPVEQGKRR